MEVNKVDCNWERVGIEKGRVQRSAPEREGWYPGWDRGWEVACGEKPGARRELGIWYC